ncbi:hypothetical protein NOCA2100044 [metagenome]|uniref:Uncharacterized protein n=1 Tax=metagenome TaxID=256318 RepID=A0A2P2BVZ5_9ZZZZ
MNDVAWIEAATIGSEAARETWALAARHLLADVAGDYHAVMTVQELGDGVQQRSRIRTRQAVHYWIGDVLFRVATDCERRREPNLGSLCIRADGTMGDWYADTVLTLRSERVADPDEHAAFERLECYRRNGAELPPGGGEPARTVRVPGSRTRATTTRTAAGPRTPRAAKASKPARVAKSDAPPPKVCDRCFMALPASGVCDYCD